MATDIGSLAPWLEGRAVRSGIGRKGLCKTWGAWGDPRNGIFLGHSLFYSRLSTHCIVEAWLTGTLCTTYDSPIPIVITLD
jgi:hypothetical protein